MAQQDFTNIASTSILTPAAGVTSVFVDSDRKLKTKDEAGFITTAGDISNFSVASQAPVAVTRTYITGSKITVPPGKLQIGTTLRWAFDITKTGAGTALSTYDIAFGILGTTGDTARVSFTKPAGTAVADNGRILIEAIVRGPLSAAGVVVGHFHLTHNLAATGHAIIPCVEVTTISAGFDLTVANLFVGVCVTSGSADVLTIQQVIAEAWNL